MSVHTASSIWASCFLFTSSKHLCLSSGALQVKGGPYLGRFTGFFHAGKNKQNTPGEVRKKKERDRILSRSCSVMQSPWLSEKTGTPKSGSIGKALFFSQDASSILILQSYSCNSMLSSPWKSFACHKCSNPPIAINKASLPGDRSLHLKYFSVGLA